MIHSLNLVPVLAATAAIFVAGWLWYSPLLFFKPWMRLRGLDPAAAMPAKMPAGKMLAELVRCFAISYLVTLLFSYLDISHLRGAVKGGVFLWVTFPVMFLGAPVIWENMNWKVAAIHAGDWLVKLILIPVIAVSMQ